MEQSNLSLYTSLCKYTKLLGDGPKGPEHVADLLLTARGSLQKCCVDAWSKLSLYTSLCKYTKRLDNGPKGPEHVAGSLLTARGFYH